MDSYLLYVDTETPAAPDNATAEQVSKLRIFEIAAILMTADLSRELGRFETVIAPTPESLDELRANPFVLQMHKDSGLYDILTSEDADTFPDLATAEQGILALLEGLPDGAKVTIAGSGVARFDRPQIAEQMKRLNVALSYDEADVSSARKRYEYITGMPIVPAKPTKTHRAMADIEDDIRYQRAFDNLYAASVSEGGQMDVTARSLTALALTEQFMKHDSFLNADGVEIYTAQPPKVIQSLLEGVPAIEVVAGYMSVTTALLDILAGLSGMLPETALEEVRRGIVSGFSTAH